MLQRGSDTGCRSTSSDAVGDLDPQLLKSAGMWTDQARQFHKHAPDNRRASHVRVKVPDRPNPRDGESYDTVRGRRCSITSRAVENGHAAIKPKMVQAWDLLAVSSGRDDTRGRRLRLTH